MRPILPPLPSLTAASAYKVACRDAWCTRTRNELLAAARSEASGSTQSSKEAVETGGEHGGWQPLWKGSREDAALFFVSDPLGGDECRGTLRLSEVRARKKNAAQRRSSTTFVL